MLTEQLYHYYLKHPSVCTDTRKIAQDCLFFALKGERFDANTFAAQALKEGAAFAVVDDPAVLEHNDDRYILVNDVLSALQSLARHHRQQLHIPVIGLTGTNGKTTTKELINAVLSQKFSTYATQGNLNNHIGVPLSILAIGPGVELAIIEMGANHQKEIEFLCQISQPTLGLITNVGKAHLEGFGGFEGVKKGKGELYAYLQESKGVVFLDNGNAYLKEMAAAHHFTEVFTYGRQGQVKGELLANNPFLEIEWSLDGARYQAKSNLTGIYNFENILAAIACGVRLGLMPQQINAGIEDYKPNNNRSQIVHTANNTVIGDFYNANPSSMAVAIDNIIALKAKSKVLILGDMFELGEDPALEHQNILERAVTSGIDTVLLVGKEFGKFHNDYPNAHFFEDTAAAKTFLQAGPIMKSLILLKGSRGMKLETLLENL